MIDCYGEVEEAALVWEQGVHDDEPQRYLYVRHSRASDPVRFQAPEGSLDALRDALDAEPEGKENEAPPEIADLEVEIPDYEPQDPPEPGEFINTCDPAEW